VMSHVQAPLSPWHPAEHSSKSLIQPPWAFAHNEG
jgi:hypothetical protein